MERLFLFLYNSVWFIINLKDDFFYRNSLRNPSGRQERILKSLLKKNRRTEFGTNNSFDKILSIKNYQEKVPISKYEDYWPYHKLLLDGQKNILTKSTISRFCLSSGTSSSSKLVPFNNELKKEFRRAISVWLNNIIRNFPAVLFGKSFWIVTPITQTNYPDSRIPVGFEEDSSYFGYIQKNLIRKVMVVPDEVSHLNNSENYYYVISWFLIKERNLRLISVWNPLVLLIIISKIIQYSSNLITDIENGTLSFPVRMSDQDELIFKKYLKPEPEEAMRLRNIFQNPEINGESFILTSKLWPRLALISCWADSWASQFAMRLNEFFPNIPIQGKGLLATEAVVTIPLKYSNSSELLYLPAINSHFFEFKGIDDQEIYQIHELRKNVKYEIIITTGGGFYRYSLNDIVEVSGFYRNIPSLKFLGKTDVVCDITGEKLNDNHIHYVLQRIRDEFSLKSIVTFISPLLTEKIPAYILFIEEIDKEKVIKNNSAISNRLDELLSENYHYKNSRNLLQLGNPEIFLMEPEAIGLYLNFKSSHSRQGSTKITSLDFSRDWTMLLPGSIIKNKT